MWAPYVTSLHIFTVIGQVCNDDPQYECPCCSLECQAAETASPQAQQPRQQSALSSAFVLPSTQLTHLSAIATCSYPGCTLPVTVYPRSGGKYCSQLHGMYANMLPLRRELANLLTTQLRFRRLHSLSPSQTIHKSSLPTLRRHSQSVRSDAGSGTLGPRYIPGQ